jgi:hypothetical protein
MRIDNPFIVFVVALTAQLGAAVLGDRLRRTWWPVNKLEREDLNTALTATLTLLALVIGFSFSMAVSRYDQRKNCEEAEASAIGTEYLRADLLPPDNATKVSSLVEKDVSQRIAFYTGAASGAVEDPARLETEMWLLVVHAATTQASPVTALAASGMNDVLNTKGFTQAAWANRIPNAAWVMMGLIAIFANLLLGYRERSTGVLALMVVPVVTSVAFFLIADIDSPRGGVIHVTPNNLMAVAQTMNSH